MSNTLNLAYTISAIDKLTPALKKIETQIKKLEQSFKKLDTTIKIKADTKAATTAIQKLAKATHSTHKVKVVETTASGKALSSSLSNSLSSSPGSTPRSRVFGHVGAGVGGGLGYMGLSGAMGNPYLIAGAAAGASMKAYADVETAQLALAKALDIDTGLINDVGITKALGTTAKDLANLSSSLGIAQTDIVSTATEFAKIGVSGDDLVQTVKYATAASEAWGTSLEDTQNTFIMLKETYGLTAEGLLDIANKVDLVGDKMGLASEQSINEWLSIASKTGAAFKLGAETMIAFGATATESGVALPTAQRDLNTLMSNAGSAKALTMLTALGGDMSSYSGLTNEGKLAFTLQTINKALSEGVDVSKDLGSVYGKDLGVSIMKMAMSYDKFDEAMRLQGDKADLDGRVLLGLTLKAKTLEGQFNRLKTSVVNWAIEIGASFNDMLQSEGVQSQLSGISASFGKFFGGADEDMRSLTNVVLVFAGALNTVMFALEAIGNLAKLVGSLLIAAFTLDLGFANSAMDDFNTKSTELLNRKRVEFSDLATSLAGGKLTVDLSDKLATKPVMTASKVEMAKQVAGVSTSTTTVGSTAGSTVGSTTGTTSLGNSKTSNVVASNLFGAANTQEGAAVKQSTAAEQNLLAAMANKEAAMANKEASMVFKAGADRLSSAPTPSISYSFMPTALGTQGR